MDLEYEPELDLNKREYVCQTCHLIHWRGAPDPCDRAA